MKKSGFKMNGSPHKMGTIMGTSAFKQNKNTPKASGRHSDERIQSMKYLNDAEDELEFLNEDLFNDRITKAEYDAKKKIIDMKIDAGRAALGNKK